MGSITRAGTRHLTIAYSPLPSQKRFHQSTARFKGFSGPIGSGKSQALCQEALRMAFLNPGRHGLIGAPTYTMLRDTTQRALLETLDSNEIRYEFNKAENNLRITDAGSKIYFRSLEEYERLRGANLAWFGVDELTYVPMEAWQRLEGRLRDPKAKYLCGFAVWTPKGFDWVYDRFIAQPITGYELIQARPFENVHVLDKVPDYYERLRSSYDPRFFEQEVLGEYVNLSSGRVYFAFDRKRHVVHAERDSNQPLLWALDFNVNPMSSIVAQRRGSQTIVLDEIVLARASTMDACLAFEKQFGYHAAGLEIYGDASGARMQTAGNSDYEVISEFLRSRGYRKAFRVPRCNPPVRERVSITNGLLENAKGETSLFITPQCKELIKDLEQVCYEPNSAMIDKTSDPRRSHLSDALGYLLWQEYGRPAIGERSERLL